MIQVRLKREKREALSSPSMRSGGKGPSTIITAGGKPVGLPRAEAITPSST
jgi:NosR/NirI family nitrous oxide reductase transcriptional regulator